MNNVVSFFLGVVVFIAAFSMLRDKTASRIRNSRFWLVGALGYIFLLSIGAKLVFPLYAEANIDDEKAVPFLFGGMVLLVLGTWCHAMYKLRKQMRG